MSSIAYALRESYAGTVTQTIDGEEREVPKFLGGLITAGDRDLNIAELLEDGDGRIVVEDRDPRVVLALDEYPALKRVDAPEGAEPVAGGYADRNVTDLRDEAKRRGIEGLGRANKDDLVAALEANDARIDVADLSLEELEAVLDNDDDVYPDAGKVIVPDAVEELRRRAHDGDETAADVLASHDLAAEGGE